MEKILGIRKKCAECGADFYFCSKCWRGHRYCNENCRIASRRKKHKIAEKKYSSTLKGKINRSERQKRFRLKLKIVTDQSIPKTRESVSFSKRTKPLTCKCTNCKRRITHEVNQPQEKLFFSFKIFINYS